ncbi:CHAT domain-containing protein [Pseudanabaena sp. ABRG5-3]|uniref:CHAT domain-containing protein n=1 Tax=Pseudanabaena sp. ABRG5-3 TaxID=685565 RepID=UPI000DC710A8|nr:CHAT domain-containing protein [Pseudanabaena sp. ABRG5-3]BBC25484.1 tetratricopeptide repeat domain protein [Pseudanabaena sp. ABRG5-3]
MKRTIANSQRLWQIMRKQNKLSLGLLIAIAVCLVIALGQPVIATNPHRQDENPLTKVGASPLAQSADSFMEQGSRLYDTGQLVQAVATWKQALQIYRDRQRAVPSPQNQLDEALCLSYLSMAYQDLGEWQEAEIAIAQGSDLISQQPSTSKERIEIAARISNAKGSLQLAKGQSQAALESWKIAVEQYTQLGDEIGQLGSLTNQAQVLQALGLFRQASEQLEAIELRLQNQPDSILKAVVLRSLGTTLQTLGDLAKSQKILERSFVISQKLNNPSESSSTLLSLGNNFRLIKDNESALKHYEQAANLASNNILRMEAQAVQLSLLIESDLLPESQTLWQQIEPQLVNLKPSRRSIYLRVNLADSLIKLQKIDSRPTQFISSSKIAESLAMAIRQAQALQDRRAESFAIGELGILYEQNRQLSEANKLAQKALVLAQESNADDLIYRWQWLLGRVFKQQGEYDRAIASYVQAVQNIQSLRRELIATAPEVQFAFRDRIEPIYRELVALLLRGEQPTQENLKQARQTLESLQVVELENYFRAACLNVTPQQIDAIDTSSAVIYSAVLSDRLAIIVSFPNAPLRYHSIAVSQADLETTANEYLQSLNPAFSDRERFKVSQKLYDWIIRPVEPILVEKQIKNLVFVLDSALRNLPMAALHDGKQYAIEKYRMALTPGLQLLGAKPLDRNQLSVWLGGLTESRQGFSGLEGVKIEAAQIALKIPTKTELDINFTKSNIQKGLTKQDTSIVHLATHGQFSSNPDSTFILAWDERLTVPDFYNFLRDRTNSRSHPLELLVLSACKTAEGDANATLGLAGIALRSGARSTIGSLWAVNDLSTSKLMSNFYDILLKKGDISRAEALQQAQISILKDSQYQHPYYWAAFVLIGSWL